MNRKMAITGVIVCVLACFAALEYVRAAPQVPGPPAKIGVVSMREVFRISKKHAQYSQQAMARQARARAQLIDLSKQAESEEAELKTLRQGTADYTKQLQVVLETRAKLQTQQEFFKQQSMLDDKKWLEDLYQAFIRATQAVAKDRGLDLVLERTEPEFPVPSEELMTTLYMHKVLYNAGCVDLTHEVTARLDADDTLKPERNP
jgi:Skp family chaperone for outer membrane proteins